MKANAEETKLNDGTITSSPGIILISIATILRASIKLSFRLILPSRQPDDICILGIWKEF
jgi:hypothetical protein